MVTIVRPFPPNDQSFLQLLRVADGATAGTLTSKCLHGAMAPRLPRHPPEVTDRAVWGSVLAFHLGFVFVF